MSEALRQALPAFVPAFVQALGTNLSLAAHALAFGLPVGAALAVLRLPAARPPGGVRGRLRCLGVGAAGAGVALLRSAPTFVVMYFLLNALPARWAVTAPRAVALALAVYAAAYVADNALEAMVDWRAGSRASALLFLMGLVRAYVVMVLSTGFGAAVGVVEATTVTLRALEQLPTMSDRLALTAIVVAVFVAMAQALYAVIGALRRRLECSMGR